MIEMSNVRKCEHATHDIYTCIQDGNERGGVELTIMKLHIYDI